MPKAPQIEQQVRAAGIPGVRLGSVATPESYGAGVGETARRIGLDIYAYESLHADRTAVFEADRKAADLQTSLEEQIKAARGKQAMGLDQTIRKQWDDGLASIEGSLASDRQRAGFSHARAQRSDQLNRLTQQHIATESDRFQDQETEAGIQSALDRVRANPTEPSILQGEFTRLQSLTAAVAARKGLRGITTKAQLADPAFHAYYAARGEPTPDEGAPYTSEAALTLRDKVLSSAHREVITGLNMQGQDLSASAYFKAHRSDLNATDRDAVERVIDEGSTRGEAQRLVRGLLRDGKTEAEILKHIDDKVDNPKIVDLAHQLVGRHFREQAAIQKEAGDTAYTTLLNKVEEQPGTHPRMLADPQVWASLSINERHAIEERSKSLVKYEKPDRANDDALWLDFLALKPEDVAKLSRRDFDQKYWSHFDNHTRQRAETQWNVYKDALSRKDEKQVDPKVTASLTFKDQVNNAWSLSGLIDPSKERSKWSKDEMMQFVRFEDQAAQALQHYELTKLDGKRHATPDEVREVIKKVRDQAVQKVFTPGRFFGSNEKAAIGLEEDEKKQAFVPIDKIPKDSLDDLTRYIESLGKKATPDKLRRAYAKKLLNDREGFNAVVNE